MKDMKKAHRNPNKRKTDYQEKTREEVERVQIIDLCRSVSRGCEGFWIKRGLDPKVWGGFR